MPESQHLIKLKEIAPKLEKSLNFMNLFAGFEYDESYKQIGSKPNHQIYFRTLLWKKKIAICDNSIAADSEFPEHQHEGNETFVIYEGELFLEYRDKVISLRVDDIYTFDARYKHSAYCEKNTRFLAITIPGDPSWRPRERRHRRDF